MVWIHGGGFTSGAGSVPWYNGASFVRNGDVVVVSINYRLGAFGWTHLAHLDSTLATSGNAGLLDQIAALQWVQQNIAAFGGDPGNVTIFGESAGGMSVATLMGTPAAAGLFHRAIAQSGAAHSTRSADQATDVTDRLLAALGVDDVAGLRAIDAAALLAAQERVEADLVRARRRRVAACRMVRSSTGRPYRNRRSTPSPADQPPVSPSSPAPTATSGTCSP